MNILTIENLTKSYTDRLLFDGASFSVQEGEKVGIIGINGTGKSTLLRIIAGEEEPDGGSVIRANHIVMRYLSQDPQLDMEKSVLDNVLEQAASDNSWDIEGEAKSMLTKLGFTDLTQKAGELSGGQRKRAALAAALLGREELLILDEPTNHLDQGMATWLENYLKRRKGALIMVTHDRYFLDSVTNRIVEIDKGQFYSYQTNYSGYLELKAQREEMAVATERKRQSVLRVELEWIRRGARARSTKQKAHIQRYEELRDQKGPEFDSKVEMGSISTRMGRTTVELHHICKGYEGRELIRDFSYIFLKNDRVGFIGKNGCGKTTLMKMLAGRIQPDSGELVVGQTIQIGYYSQEIEEQQSDARLEDGTRNIAYMDPKMRVIDYIKETAEYIRTEDGLVSASSMLERFLFPADQQYSLIGKLSGGEKRRLNLLRILVGAPNVLILDEPTNSLDIATLTVLEDYLDHFQGIFIIVSHDRYFLDRTVNRIFAFENGALTQYEGNYTDYENRVGTDGYASDLTMESSRKLSGEETSNAGNPDGLTGKEAYKASKQNGQKKLKFSYKEQREYETIEEDIAALEEKLETLDADMVANATNSKRLSELVEEKEAAEQELEEKMERWEYLEDLAEQIRNQDA